MKEMDLACQWLYIWLQFANRIVIDVTGFLTPVSVYESQIFRTLHVDGGGAGDLKGGYLRHITNR
ncbi:hypothetical protein LXL04_031733 [Taraxacum kok-saghyz]